MGVKQQSGMMFDGTDIGALGFWLTKTTRKLIPGSRQRKATIAGRAGQYDAGSEYDIKQIDLEFACVLASRTDVVSALTELAALFDPGKGYRQLVFDDDAYRYRWAKLVGDVPLSITLQNAAFPLSVECADPFDYHANAQTITWDPVGGGSTTLVNAGTAKTPLLITISAPAGQTLTGFSVDVGGTSVGYAGSLSGSDQLVIDTNAYTVSKNGDRSAVSSWTGEMPQLPPGDTTVTESDTGNVGAQVQFTYTERDL